MPDTRESSRATPDALLRQSLRLGTVATAGPKPLKCKWDFEFPRGAHDRRGTLRKSRGLLTHRPGRCNIAQGTRHMAVSGSLLTATDYQQHVGMNLGAGRVDQRHPVSAEYAPTRGATHA